MTASATADDPHRALIAALAAGLDRAALERLADLDPGGRNGLLPRVLATFETSLRRQLDSCAQARRSDDADVLRHVAHTLKSSSASVGALGLSQSCAEVERELRVGTTAAALAAALDRLEAEGRAVQALLAPWVARAE